MPNKTIPNLTDGTGPVNPFGTSNLIHVWNSSLGRSEKKTMDQMKTLMRGLGTTLTTSGGWDSGSWPVSTILYFGDDLLNSTMTGLTTYANAAMQIPRDGTIVYWSIRVRITTNGSATPSVQHFLRLNDTTDFAQLNLFYNLITREGAQAATQAVSAGDSLAIKVVTPAWVTPPQGVRVNAWVYIN